MKTEHQAYCPFCGVQFFVEAEIDADEPMLRAMAIDKCDCQKAVAHKKMKHTRESIDAICGEGCTNGGFGYVFGETSIRAVNQIAELVAEGVIDNVSFTEPLGDTIRLRDADSRVKIRRQMKISAEI